MSGEITSSSDYLNARLIDETKTEVLCRALIMGNTHTTACKLANINYDLFRRWMALGGHPLSATKKNDVVDPGLAEEPYATFARAVVEAKATAESRAVNQIIAAGDRDWKAAAWYLEKSNPDEWAPEKKNASIQIGTTSGVQIFLPDNGRADANKALEANTIIEGEIREIDN